LVGAGSAAAGAVDALEPCDYLLASHSLDKAAETYRVPGTSAGEGALYYLLGFYVNLDVDLFGTDFSARSCRDISYSVFHFVFYYLEIAADLNHLGALGRR